MPILPVINREFYVSEAFLGWLITAYAVVLSGFALVAGPLSDRIGRRKPLIAISCPGSDVAMILLPLAAAHAVLLYFTSL